MSTRCFISIRSKDKEGFDYIYCHFDGGSYVRCMLEDHYYDESKIRALMDLGDISSLRQRVSPNATEKHSFNEPLKDVTIAYRRDRSEISPSTETGYALNHYELFLDAEKSAVDYLHVYEKGEWKSFRNPTLSNASRFED